MSDSATNWKITARRAPGLLERLEAESARGADLDPDPALLASIRGGGAGGITPARWKSLLDRVRGYRAGEVVLDREPLWLHLIDLHVPSGGTATFSYEHTGRTDTGLDLKVLGVGFGSGVSVAIEDSMTLPAADSGKALRARMLLTAQRYETRAGDSLVRLDLSPPDVPEYEVTNLPATPPADLTDPLKWRVVRRERLSGSTDSRARSWSYSCEREARWSVKVGVTLPAPVGEIASFHAEVAQADRASVAFDMPYGHDYAFYVPAGESPLAPLVATGP